MPDVALDPLRLHYEDAGSGAPLLLVAGLASDSQSWPLVFGPLAEKRRVIAPDNRGVGRSLPQDAPCSIAAMADDCIALLDHLGIDRADVLGHSMGGFVAQDLAVRHPHRVRKLVLAATGASASARNRLLFADFADAFDAGVDPAAWFRMFFYWIFTPRFFLDRAMVEAATAFALNYPYPQSARGFRNQVNAIAAFDGSRALATITVPVLVLAGRDDLVFPLAEVERFAAAIPGAKLAVVDGAAHAIQAEQPAEFVRIVLEFLQRQP